MAKDYPLTITQVLHRKTVTLSYTQEELDELVKIDFCNSFEYGCYNFIPYEFEFEGRKFTLLLMRSGLETFYMNALSFLQFLFNDLGRGLDLYLNCKDKVWILQTQYPQERPKHKSQWIHSRFINLWDHFVFKDFSAKEIKMIEAFNVREWEESILQPFFDLCDFEKKILLLNDEIEEFNKKLDSFEKDARDIERRKEEILKDCAKFPSAHALDVHSIKRFCSDPSHKNKNF